MTTSIPTDLAKGYQRFTQGRRKDLAPSFDALAISQAPATMVISCADSRVDPGTIFDAGPGELFVVRNVANLVPPYKLQDAGALNYHGTSAAIEYAVKALGVQRIVVMGHGGCGGVGACLAAKHEELPFEFIGEWVGILDDAREVVLAADPEDKQQGLEHEGVRQSITRLMDFPFVKQAVDDGALELHGAWFHIGPASLHWLTSDGQFTPVSDI